MRWITTILIFSILQWYAFQAIKTITSNRLIWLVYGVIVIVIIGNLLLHSFILERPGFLQRPLQ